MSSDTPYARAFRLAIETLGGAEQVAQALDAPVTDVEAWATGVAHPPANAFLKAIDLVSTRWGPRPPCGTPGS
jgi:hypothetical protein